MRQLLLMRHAKSDWDADYSRDHERPLAERGQGSARLMGRVLAGLGLAPDLVISSTAVRARSTAQLAAHAGRWTAPICLDEGLYEAGPDEVVTLAAGTPQVPRLMLVGHQPTWGQLVRGLTGEDVEMKTASVAVIDLDLDDWAHLPGTGGSLASAHHPKAYLGSRWDDG